MYGSFYSCRAPQFFSAWILVSLMQTLLHTESHVHQTILFSSSHIEKLLLVCNRWDQSIVEEVIVVMSHFNPLKFGMSKVSTIAYPEPLVSPFYTSVIIKV